MGALLRRRVTVGRLVRLTGLSVAVWLAGCQAVNTTSGGAVGVERKQYMFSMLSTQQVNQMYEQSYQQTLSEASGQEQQQRQASQCDCPAADCPGAGVSPGFGAVGLAGQPDRQ